MDKSTERMVAVGLSVLLGGGILAYYMTKSDDSDGALDEKINEALKRMPGFKPLQIKKGEIKKGVDCHEEFPFLARASKKYAAIVINDLPPDSKGAVPTMTLMFIDPSLPSTMPGAKYQQIYTGQHPELGTPEQKPVTVGYDHNVMFEVWSTQNEVSGKWAFILFESV